MFLSIVFKEKLSVLTFGWSQIVIVLFIHLTKYKHTTLWSDVLSFYLMVINILYLPIVSGSVFVFMHNVLRWIYFKFLSVLIEYHPLMSYHRWRHPSYSPEWPHDTYKLWNWSHCVHIFKFNLWILNTRTYIELGVIMNVFLLFSFRFYVRFFVWESFKKQSFWGHSLRFSSRSLSSF